MTKTKSEILTKLEADNSVSIDPDNFIAAADLVREGKAVCNQGQDGELFLMLPGNKWD